MRAARGVPDEDAHVGVAVEPGTVEQRALVERRTPRRLRPAEPGRRAAYCARYDIASSSRLSCCRPRSCSTEDRKSDHSGAQPGGGSRTAPAELPGAPGGIRTRDLSSGVDNRPAGPQQRGRRGRVVRSGARSRTARPRRAALPRDNRTAPARDDVKSKPARIRTRACEVGARRAAVTPRACARSGRGLESNGPPAEWRLRCCCKASRAPSADACCRAGADPEAGNRCVPRTLCPELGREEPPAGVEPAPRPYKGRVLAVDTTEARRWRRRESNPHPLGASEALCQLSFIPECGRCGRMESNHHSARQRVYSAVSSPVLSVRMERRATGRIRTGTAGITTPDAAVTPRPP